MNVLFVFNENKKNKLSKEKKKWKRTIYLSKSGLFLSFYIVSYSKGFILLV